MMLFTGTAPIDLTPGRPIKLAYDETIFPFRQRVRDILLGVQDRQLEELHQPIERLQRATDQSTVFHQKFYDNFEALRLLYEEFVKGFVKPFFGHVEIVYQRVPTFRVQLINNVAVGTWHRDSEFGHAEHEVNFWLPFTDAWGSNTVWIEAGDTYLPEAVKHGEVLVFAGSRLMHGNVPNLTGRARVSMDFRAYPAWLHKDREDVTVSAGRQFKLGDYWAGPV